MVAMLEQRIDPELDREPVLKRLVETAAHFLDEETKDTAYPAVATWSLNPNSGSDRVNLYIRDPNLNVWAQRNFSTAELSDIDELEKDIIRVWGTLLERRSGAGIKKLMQSLAEEGAGK